jgi:tetratricopeptide (TPR) repeat protein
MSTEQSNSQFGKSVGAKIREVRLSKKYTQTRLAAPDFSVSYISAIERGQIHPSLRALEILANRLGIPSAQLIPPENPGNHAIGFTIKASKSDEALIELALLEAQLYILQGDAIKAIADLSALSTNKLHKRHLLQQCILLSKAYLLTYQLQKCMNTLADADSLANELNDASSSLRIYDLIGAAYASMGDPARALQALQHCLALAGTAQPQDPFFMCHLYNQLGQLYAQKQQFDAAVNALTQAIEITEVFSTLEKLQTAYWNSTLHYAASKKYQSAHTNLYKYLALRNQQVNLLLRSEIYHNLGRVLMKGDQAKARTFLEDTLQKKHDQLDALTLASIMTRLAEWHLLHSQLAEAEKYAEKAFASAKPSGTTLIASEALINCGRIHYAQAMYESGDSYFKAGLEMLEQLRIPEEDSNQSALYAQLLEERGKIQEALQYYKRAFESQRSGGEYM